MNWDHVRVFLAVARQGTLRSAARTLGLDQATASRRVAALEAELCTRLFLRTPTALLLTEAGETLLGSAEQMEGAALSMEQRSAGRDREFAGTVRIATTESLAAQFVLPAMQQLRARHPDIGVQCFTSSHVTNMSRRVADIAIRTLRPDAPDLITRRLGRYARGIYASRQYVEARGTPQHGSAFRGHDLIVYQREVEPLGWEHMCGEPTSNGRIVFQASSTSLLLSAALAGLGITELSAFRAEQHDQLVRLLPERSEPYDVWLVMHPDLYRTARMQAVVALLSEQFDRVCGQ